MPVSVVLAHRHRHGLRRMRRGMSALIGGLMVGIGLTASVAWIPLIIVFVSHTGEEGLANPSRARALSDMAYEVFGASIVITVLGLVIGLRLLRGTRKLVLFLRRFGYREATHAITFAAAKIVGRSWRLVTLDDAAVAPLGVAAAARRVFRAGSLTAKAVGKATRGLMKTGVCIIVGGIAGMVGIYLIIYLRHGDPTPLAESLRLSGPIHRNLPGAFHVFFLATLGAWLSELLMIPLLLLQIALLGPYVFGSLSSRAVRTAEESKVAEIRSSHEIETATDLIVRQSRKFFSARMVVLKVASTEWKRTVQQLASVSSASLIDVSEPTENLLWEIHELTGLRSRCVLVGQYDRVRYLAGGAEEAWLAGALNGRLSILLDGQEVLAYTTDRHGMRRFARALRAELESLSG